MALQDGFKVLGLKLISGGSGYMDSDDGADGTLRMVAPGSSSIGVGDGFTGTYTTSTNSDGVIASVAITAAGKNYSSGSWDVSGHGHASVGEHCSIVIFGENKNTAATGTGGIVIPTIGQNLSMSFSDINVERGVAANTANSDIHDLYEDFSSIAGAGHEDVTGKPNFDWFQGGPRSASSAGNYQSHPIRLDEFYGSNYSQYGGSGCLGLGTKITMADGNLKDIENINVGDWVRAATVPGMPLDFDEEDTWSVWQGTPHGNDSGQYDIQIQNTSTPASASVQHVYFDYYDNYYLINGSLKATYEHPFFILRDGSYYFKTTVSLVPGDKLYTSNNEFVNVDSILFVNEPLETVNLNVENLDVYFGGSYLMHNVHGK